MPKVRIGRWVMSLLSGNFLTEQSSQRQIPYFAFLALLLLLTVAHRYASEKILREINDVQASIKEYRSLSISAEAELMRVNRPSLINEKVKERGMDIHDPSKPPRELRVKKIED
ncbi:MAG: FtsL-like putative cell division protein [Mangrovibacterium sp.]